MKMGDQANHKDTNANALPNAQHGFSGYFVVAFVDLLGTCPFHGIRPSTPR
jgi:hypothetical protein